VLGQELAGDVDAVGRKVRSLRKGDRVFAATGIGLGALRVRLRLRVVLSTEQEMERETGLEPATFSLEGRDARAL
jgi:NADPH:quinone reductase-like Zn-dependent oxidoreductase